jgi:hypothetical protein
MSLSYEIDFNSGSWTITSNVQYLEVTNTINDKYQNSNLHFIDNGNVPSIGDSVTITIDSVEVFIGYVARINKEIKGVIIWKLQLIGKTYDLWREIVDNTGTTTYANDYTSYFISSLCSDYTSITFPQNDDIGQMLKGEYDYEGLSVGEAVFKINEFDDYNFYVNKDDELIYYKPAGDQITINENNLIRHNTFELSDDSLYNHILVRGNGVQASATDATSISTYGKHSYIINNTMITDEDDAQELADKYLAEYKDPTLSGVVYILGDTSITLSQNIEFDLTNLDITGGGHKVIAYSHILDKSGFITKISFGRKEYEPQNDFDFLRMSNSNVQYGVFKAIADAASAQAAADGTIVSYWQTSEPSSGMNEGDIWFDTSDGNKIYRYDGADWLEAQDDEIAAALLAASTAQSTADGKITTHYSESMPNSVDVSYGDIWYRLNAPAETASLYMAGTDNASSMGDWYSITDWRANWENVFGDNIPDDNATSNKTFTAASAPNGVGESQGDIWIKTTNGTPYIYDGSNWKRSSWSSIVDDPDAPKSNATRNSLIRQSSEPDVGSYPSGSMWVDTDTGTPFIHDGYAWRCTSWSMITDDGSKPADNATENKTFYQESEPSGIGESGGDVWIKSSTGTPYVYCDDTGSWKRSAWDDIAEDLNAPESNATRNVLVRQTPTPNPGNYSSGDMWVKLSTGEPYIHDGIDWRSSTWEIISKYNNAPDDNADVTENQNQPHGWLYNIGATNHHIDYVDAGAAGMVANVPSTGSWQGPYSRDRVYMATIGVQTTSHTIWDGEVFIQAKTGDSFNPLLTSSGFYWYSTPVVNYCILFANIVFLIPIGYQWRWYSTSSYSSVNMSRLSYFTLETS